MATVIGIFENQYKNNKPLTVVKPGNQSRRFTHIDDTVNALKTVITSDDNNDTIQIITKDLMDFYYENVVPLENFKGWREKEINTKQIIAYDGDLQNRNNGKFYLKGTTNLFTGIEILHYAAGTIKQQLPLTNGVAQGTRMRWHSNGVMESIGSYSNGMRTGYWKTWNFDGEKNKEGTFVKGKPDGKQIFWHTNGR